MPYTLTLILTTTGADTGPLFDLYSNVDTYTTPFETNVPKSSLITGFTTSLVPNFTETIRVTSKGDCTNSIDIQIPCTCPEDYTRSGDTCYNGSLQVPCGTEIYPCYCVKVVIDQRDIDDATGNSGGIGDGVVSFINEGIGGYCVGGEINESFTEQTIAYYCVDTDAYPLRVSYLKNDETISDPKTYSYYEITNNECTVDSECDVYQTIQIENNQNLDGAASISSISFANNLADNILSILTGTTYPIPYSPGDVSYSEFPIGFYDVDVSLIGGIKPGQIVYLTDSNGFTYCETTTITGTNETLTFPSVYLGIENPMYIELLDGPCFP
jgi:hypothetical protein